MLHLLSSIPEGLKTAQFKTVSVKFIASLAMGGISDHRGKPTEHPHKDAIDETLTYPVLVMSEAERLFRQQQSLTSAGKGQNKSRQMRRARQTHKGKRFGQF